MAGQDQAVALNDLAADTVTRHYRAAFDGTAADSNEVRADAFQQAVAALNNNVFHDQATKSTYLQDIHKEIAIRRITMYLADHGGRGAILANALPHRTAGDVVAGGLPFTDANNYQDYEAFIRGTAYDATQLNNFVSEICGKINHQRGLGKVNA